MRDSGKTAASKATVMSSEESYLLENETKEILIFSRAYMTTDSQVSLEVAFFVDETCCLSAYRSAVEVSPKYATNIDHIRLDKVSASFALSQFQTKFPNLVNGRWNHSHVPAVVLHVDDQIVTFLYMFHRSVIF